MRSIRLSLLTFLLASIVSAGAWAQDSYQVVVHPSNPASTLSEDELMELFLKKVPKWPHGVIVEPIDLREDSPVRQDFSLEVIGRRVSQVKAYWLQKSFSGRQYPPPEVSTDSAVISFVRNNPGAIGYTSKQASVGSLKVVEIKETSGGR